MSHSSEVKVPRYPGVMSVGVAAGDRHGVDVAADRPEVAHQPADEGDRPPIGRDAREVELHRRARRSGVTAPLASIDAVERRDPPIVVAVAARARGDEAAPVGQPVIFVDIAVGGLTGRSVPAGQRDDSDALLIIDLADLADLADAGLRGARFLAR